MLSARPTGVDPSRTLGQVLSNYRSWPEAEWQLWTAQRDNADDPFGKRNGAADPRLSQDSVATPVESCH
jgi:hypothetical protein